MSEELKPMKYDEEEGNQFIEFARFLYEYFEVAEKWKEIQKFAGVHPAISLFLLMTIGMCSVPVIVFTIFVISSVAVSIMTVFLFEGTIIAMATVVLIAVLCFVIVGAFCFSGFLISCYYMIKLMGSFLSGFTQYFTSIPLIGGVFRESPYDKEE
ncbi:hypothetical protein ACF0H5_001788 [Mactra antiquata]